MRMIDTHKGVRYDHPEPKDDPMPTAKRKPTNLSLDSALLNQAKALNVNLSRAAEEGVALAVKKAREAAWKEENADAIQGYNEWVEENGIPLSKFRQF